MINITTNNSNKIYLKSRIIILSVSLLLSYLSINSLNASYKSELTIINNNNACIVNNDNYCYCAILIIITTTIITKGPSPGLYKTDE